MRFILKRILLPVLALLALGLIIWFIGPLFVFAGWAPLEHPVARIVLFVVLVSLWGLNRLRKYLKSKKANEALVEQVAEVDPDEARSQEEIQLLQDRLQDALAVLKESKFGGDGERQSLYEVPWYIIVGPPGAGKTTALVNSGLNFPLAEKFGHDALKGVGGTRNCDWWFTDEAVLIDTAGRYTTQDSNKAQDAAAWGGFLDLLKKHRKRRPINGALVAISVSELLSQSRAERSQHAKTIKQRIQELQSKLGIRFPVYVLLTKCDLLAGFSEFFDDLRRDQREQVWGMTFTLSDRPDDNPIADEFEPLWEGLEQRLNDHVLERLEYERAPARRDLIYAFPQQIASLKPTMSEFLSEIFKPTRYDETPMLRGVYLTSATQEGNPIDRILGAVANTFGVSSQVAPAFSGRGRSYFLTRLMQDVIFAESGLAGTNRKEERRRAWLQRAAYASCFVLLAAGILAWTISYRGNTTLMAEVDVAAEEADDELNYLRGTGQSQSYASMLPSATLVETIPTGYADQRMEKPVPFSRRFGLYQGHKLGREAEATYIRLLHNLMLPKMLFQIEDALKQGLDDPVFLYETLKVYLSMERPERFDPEYTQDWYFYDWSLNPPANISQEGRPYLDTHLIAITENWQDPFPLALDERLIEDARAVLRRLPMASRVLGRLKLVAQNSDKAPPFRLDRAGGKGTEVVFQRRSGIDLADEVPGLWTYQGYQSIFKPESRAIALQLLKEQWVLGEIEDLGDIQETAREVDRLMEEVTRLYFEEYIEVWDRLLADIEVVPLSSGGKAVDVLNEASRPSSPLKKVLVAVAKELNLKYLTDTQREIETTACQNAMRGVNRAINRIGIRRSNSTDCDREEADPTLVDEHFEELIELAENDGGDIDRVLLVLEDMYVYLDEVVNTGEPSPGNRDPAPKLRSNSRRQPQPLQNWMKSLAWSVQKTSEVVVAAGATNRINQDWTAQVVPTCRQVTSTRYPFVPNSNQETTLREFGQLFGPGGTIDQFYNQHLASYMDTTASPWIWKRTSPDSPRFNRQSARSLELARNVRDSFFQDGGMRPSIRFQLTPVFLDDAVDSFTLSLEGQTLNYRHGPIRSVRMNWPGDGDFAQVQLQIDPPSTRGRSTVIIDGPWAWLRLLDRSRITPDETDPSAVIVEFDVDGRIARFRLQSDSTVNPFTIPDLVEFSCPSNISADS